MTSLRLSHFLFLLPSPYLLANEALFLVLFSSPMALMYCITVKSTVIQNKKLIFALPFIKREPIETKKWPNTINLFLWCQKSNFWRTAMGGSQLRLYKFPGAQPVYPHTAGKLYCLWCWGLEVSISLGKFTFSLYYFLFLTKLKKREIIGLCLIFFRTEYLHYILYKYHLCICILHYFSMWKSEYLWLWGDF